MPTMLILLILTLSAGSPVNLPSQACLHDGSESAEQKQRRSAALGAARRINTLQARAATSGDARYLTQGELARRYADAAGARPPAKPLTLERGADVIPGWTLTLDRSEQGYWFMIKDRTDPCAFAYVSNQEGVIYTAEAIR